MPTPSKPAYYVYDVPKGSPKNQRIYFKSYEEARTFVRTHKPPGDTKGIYHIYPVDNSGYTSKSEGRTSFGEGNKDWEKRKKP
jgi:hypothetical protein